MKASERHQWLAVVVGLAVLCAVLGYELRVAWANERALSVELDKNHTRK
jgi:hypothetical protein